jgi:hypothetical protein
VATLTHRYTFNTNAEDVVGNSDAILHGNATVTNGQVVLDGSADTYVELPAAILEGYDAVTIDTWVTFRDAATWARLWYFGDDRANEFYIAPSVLDGTAHWYSTGFPVGGQTITLSPRWENQTLHITATYGNGNMEYYTNGVLHGSAEVTGRMEQVGTWFSWIGRSPYADPFLNASVDEFRIYRGRLSPQQIQEADVLGPNQLPVPGTSLAISLTSTNVLLSWPASAGEFSVQARTNLLSGDWLTLSNVTPTQVSGSWQVGVPTNLTMQFFRLSR